MQRTNIYLSDEQIAELDELATSRRVSRAELIRELLDQGLHGRPAGVEHDLAALDATFGALADADLDLLPRTDGEREAHLERTRAQ